MTHWTPDRRDLDEPRPARTVPAAPGPDSAGTLVRQARFGRWDGSQQVADLNADEIIDTLADDVMADGDLGDALQRLLERGWRSGDASRPDLPGLEALRERLRARREELLNRYRLGDVLGDVRAELKAIVQAEREGIDRRLADAGAGQAPTPELANLLRDTVARRLDRLDALPDDLGDQIRALEEYDFLDTPARERFEALVERLRHSVLDRYEIGRAHV